MSNRFENKVVVITGGTTGIGFAAAQRFVTEGANVVATGTNPETLETARQNLPEAEFISSDASDASSVESLFDHIRSTHGRVDVLFLNAGIARFSPLDLTDEKQFDDLFNINVKGPWLAIKNAKELLSEGGSIIATTSVAGQRPFDAASLYSATKSALRGLLRSISLELQDKSIRVNAISPGPIDTPIVGKLGMTANDFESMGTLTTAGRVGTSEEVAGAVAFLASDDASYVNGVELEVDGGFVYA